MLLPIVLVTAAVAIAKGAADPARDGPAATEFNGSDAGCLFQKSLITDQVILPSEVAAPTATSIHADAGMMASSISSAMLTRLANEAPAMLSWLPASTSPTQSERGGHGTTWHFQQAQSSTDVETEQRLWHVKDSEPGLRIGHVPNACPVIHAVIPLTLLSVSMLLAMLWLTRQASADCTAEAARSVGLFQQFCGMCNYSVVILESYRLSKALGHTAAFSGQLIGIYMLAAAVGGFLMALVLKVSPGAWQHRPREMLIFAQCINIIGFGVYAWTTATVTYEAVQSVGEGARLSCALMVARIMSGVGHGFCAQLLQVSFAHLTPNAERPSQMVRFFFVNTVGIGLGPVIAASMRWLDFCPAGKPPRFELAGLSQLVMALGALVAVAMFYPRLEDVQDFVPLDPVAAEPASPKQLGSVPIAERKVAVLGCMLSTFIRAAVTSGVEGATSLLLEMEYAWHPRNIGIVIGATFLCCLPAKFAIDGCKAHLTVFHWIHILCSISIVGSFLLFCHSWFTLLLADVLLFPSLYLSDGMVRGLMQQYALPSGSMFDQNHTTFWAMVLNSCGRYLGPWTARYLLEKANQTSYAIFQSMFTAAFWIVFEVMIVRKFFCWADDPMEVKSDKFHLGIVGNKDDMSTREQDPSRDADD